jgi:hypothetical protein
MKKAETVGAEKRQIIFLGELLERGFAFPAFRAAFAESGRHHYYAADALFSAFFQNALHGGRGDGDEREVDRFFNSDDGRVASKAQEGLGFRVDRVDGAPDSFLEVFDEVIPHASGARRSPDNGYRSGGKEPREVHGFWRFLFFKAYLSLLFFYDFYYTRD